MKNMYIMNTESKVSTLKPTKNEYVFCWEYEKEKSIGYLLVASRGNRFILAGYRGDQSMGYDDDFYIKSNNGRRSCYNNAYGKVIARADDATELWAKFPKGRYPLFVMK